MKLESGDQCRGHQMFIIVTIRYKQTQMRTREQVITDFVRKSLIGCSTSRNLTKMYDNEC